MKLAQLGKIVLGALVFVSAISCASFPVPKSDDDAILIIPMQTTSAAGASYFGNCVIRIKKDSGGSPTLINLMPGAKYAMVKGMKPGSYSAVERFFTYSNGFKTEPKPETWKFTLGSRSITIVNATFTYVIDRQQGRSYPSVWGYWDKLTPEVAKDLLKDLSREENFKAWQLSDATKSNSTISQAMQELGL
jgi:hypothetical protein